MRARDRARLNHHPLMADDGWTGAQDVIVPLCDAEVNSVTTMTRTSAHERGLQKM